MEARNLSKTYAVKEMFAKKRFQALKNADFCLDEGECVSVIGSSGSGKTTLGRILANLTGCDGGTVKYFAKEMKAYSAKELSFIVQMIFQNPYASLNPKLKIRDSLSEALAQTETGGAYVGAMEKVMEKVGLDAGALDNYPHQFSGGQRQRIAIARVLLKNPGFIIADEPFASLDIYSRNLILNIFEDIKKTSKTSIMLITHDISAASRFAERMLIMEKGEIIRDCSFKNIVNEKENGYISGLISSMEL